MRVLQVNSSYALGGAETVARQLHSGCQRAGYETRMLIAHGKAFDRAAGVEPMYPRLLSRLYMSRFHQLTERLLPHDAFTDRTLARLGHSRWDVLHVHNFHGDYGRIETLAALAQMKPLVWTFHGCWGITGGCDHTGGCETYQTECGECPQVGRWSFLSVDDTRRQLQRKRTAFRGAPFHVVSPSRWLAARISSSQVGSGWRVRVIPNGVDAALFSDSRKHDGAFRSALGIAANATIVLLVNRNFKDDTKGFALAREAIGSVSRPDLQVLLVGLNGDWAAQQLPGVNTRALGFIASRQELAAYYEAADIFLCPSPEETFPCAVLEAMASGCCVVATPTAGAREQVADSVSGLVAADFTAGALAHALGVALADPTLRRRVGAAARAAVLATFSEERMIASYLDLYCEIAAAANN